MTRLYESLVEIAEEDGIDQKVKDYLKDAENLHREIIHKYKLWKEFLKRSERFKGVCEWFEEAKQSCPYPAELKPGFCTALAGYA